ncbi:hypothetical protein N5C79_21020, partial [Pantoea brenneri]|uniref:hypothetical protein n=1 Tax=Pantoea brenneri TaxID=472694 RepID=UPI002447E8AF
RKYKKAAGINGSRNRTATCNRRPDWRGRYIFNYHIYNYQWIAKFRFRLSCRRGLNSTLTISD